MHYGMTLGLCFGSGIQIDIILGESDIIVVLWTETRMT